MLDKLGCSKGPEFSSYTTLALSMKPETARILKKSSPFQLSSSKAKANFCFAFAGTDAFERQASRQAGVVHHRAHLGRGHL